MKRPTITDIAREAGVSKGAVSYALNGRPGVSEATRHRITEIARELGWSPSSTARALSGGRAGAIGLVLGRSDVLGAEPFLAALLEGIERELLLQVVPGVDAELALYRRWRGERRVDGVLLAGPGCADELSAHRPAGGGARRFAGPPGGAVGVGGRRGRGGRSAGIPGRTGPPAVVRIAGPAVFADARDGKRSRRRPGGSVWIRCGRSAPESRASPARGSARRAVPCR